ncbi:MAG: S8 family serine peptidase, partial [Bdellovibrionales bacterium]|nr:S8 family serine peptidase [Bdellovibrionales bacterium]
MVSRIGAILGLLLLSQYSLAAEYIVKLKSANTISFAAVQGVSIQDYHAAGNLYQVDVDDNTLVDTLAELNSDPNVEYVVKNFKLQAFRAPLSPEALKEQWAVAKVNAEKAWQLAKNKGSRQVTIAVIDTGVDYNHPALKPNAVPGYDFKGNDSDPMDETGAQNPGHGTHCAGIMGSTGLVDGGTIGLSPEVSIMPIRFLGADGSGDLMAGIKSIDYAIEKKVQVISASWGAAVPASQATPLIEAVQRADDAGVIFVAAAANDGKNNDTRDVFPANSGTKNMIAVAASGPNDEKPSWSNFGKAKVDLASPGLTIMSTLPNNSYGNLSGTSMA